MGQKVSPISQRLGINKVTDSRWIAGKKDYAKLLAEDNQIRSFIEKKLKKAGLAKIVIERLAKKVVVTVHTSRPGMIIGKNGADIETLRNDIKKLVKNDQVVVNIYEVRRPDLNAQLVAQGIKVMCSGRLNGAEIARSEQIREGRIPLHTLRADIDYAAIQAKTTYGVVGVKVWIYTGDVVNKEKLASEMARPTEYAGSSERKSK